MKYKHLLVENNSTAILSTTELNNEKEIHLATALFDKKYVGYVRKKKKEMYKKFFEQDFLSPVCFVLLKESKDPFLIAKSLEKEGIDMDGNTLEIIYKWLGFTLSWKGGEPHNLY